MKSWWERLVVVALCAAVGAFYVWTVRSSGDPWKFGREQRDYYNLLIDGWLDGQLHMKVAVPEALLKIKDPYDPAQRPVGLGIHDASFFRGKYYLYFGAAPAVVLMLPFRLWSGIDLPLAVAVLVFVYGAFLVSVALLLDLRRRYFPEASWWFLAIGVPVLGLAGLGPVLLRRPLMWELPIGAGSCFALLALLCVWRSLHPARPALVRALRSRAGDTQGIGAWAPQDFRRRAWWFAGAGLCLGLAIASRPTYLIAGPMLAVPLLVWWREERRLPWSPLLAALAPLVLIGSAMAWHNHARFGDPLQFGQAYQFSLDYESKMAHFRLTHAPFNLWRYFFSAADWSSVFPFIRPAALPPKPAGFGGHDDVYGLFTNLPFACLALIAPLALWRRDRRERVALGCWLAVVSVLFAALAGTLVIFFGSLARYQSDFAPALMLLAVAGWLAAGRWFGVMLPRVRQGSVVFAGGAAGLFSGGFAILYSLQLNGLFAAANADGWRETARLLHVPVAAWERWSGVRRGPWEAKVVIAPAPAGTRTLVLEVGRPPAAERVWITHAAEGRIALEVEAASGRRVSSAPLPFSLGSEHILRVETGALLPGPEQPAWSGLSFSGTLAALRHLRVSWDGARVIDASPWHGGAEPAEVFLVGASGPQAGAVQIRSWRRDENALPSLRLEAASAAEGAAARFSTRGEVEVRITLSAAASVGAREPLLVTGNPGRGDIVGVEYGAGGSVRFFLDHWGSSGRFSPPISLPRDRPVGIRILADSLRAPSAWWRPRNVTHGDLRVEVDGREIWRQPTEFFVVDPVEVAVGGNPIGGTACGPVFSGEIHSVTWGRSPRP